MKSFTEHTQAQGLSYLAHWCFAIGVAWRLMNSVFTFTLHAFFPFMQIERRLDLEATMEFIKERNEWIKNSKKNRRLDAYSMTVQDQMHHEHHSFSRQ